VTPVPGDFTDRRGRWLNIVARRAPGVSQEPAVAGTRTLYRAILASELPDLQMKDQRSKDEFLNHKLDLVDARHGINHLRDFWREPLVAIMVMVGLVLLIGCANVANLLLARAAGRSREIAIRVSVGAGRWAIVRQLMTESLLLAAAGGAVGLLIASWTSELLIGILPEDGFGGWLVAGLDLRVLGFNIAVSALTGLLFGLAPALQASRPDLAPGMGNRGNAARGQNRLRRVLVVAQVAFSLVLLAGAGLFARTLSNLNSIDPGFRAERLLKFQVAPMLSGYSVERSNQFLRDLRRRLAELPGVQAVGAANCGPFTNCNDGGNITIEGYRGAEDTGATLHGITAGYFRALGAHIAAGRELADADELSTRKLVLVNEAFVKEYFPGANPLGRRLAIGSGTPDREIAGVVRNLKHDGLSEDSKPTVFYPYTQPSRPVLQLYYFVRAAGDEAAASAAIRRVVREMDVTVPVLGLQPMTVIVEESLYRPRLTAFLATAFGLLAALLAALGLYGVVAYNVERRRPEIGVRLALGGLPGDVLRLVMRDVAVMVAIGVAVGLPVAIAGARLVRSQLYGLTPEDPLALGVAVALLGAIGALSGFLPARRASRVDPIVALRYE
jgi:predicted permease